MDTCPNYTQNSLVIIIIVIINNALDALGHFHIIVKGISETLITTER